MGTPKDSNVSSDRKKWHIIFKDAVRMLQTQQTQIESVLKEIKKCAERINLHNDQISQMKSDFTVQEKARVVEEAKFDRLLSMKQREAFLSKLKLEDVCTELDDFKAWFDYLSKKCSELNNLSKPTSAMGEGRRVKALEKEISRLKSENEKLVLSNNSEVSTLLSEKNFVWDQYNRMEREKTDELRTKCAEVNQANEKTQKLLMCMEQLQSSMDQKDNVIVTLKNSVAKLEAVSDKQSKEFARLSRELEMLRKSKNGSVTPVLHRCVGEKTSHFGGKNSIKDGRDVVKKDSCPSRVHDLEKDSEKGCSSSKRRRAIETIPLPETPKLFSSTFKVPKLKNPSPRVI